MSKTTAAAVRPTEKSSDSINLEVNRANGGAVVSQLLVFQPSGLRIFTCDEFGQLTDNTISLVRPKFAKLYRGKIETRAVAVKLFIDSSTSDSDSILIQPS
ncbi:hypothetical protein ACH5RR_022367 [Cinchona calisaya]|uniref:Uncharacterized protein n=1 Tax=Cinchona calisaya TaxID=153742 RepID=A0ABD2Z7M0_9GENT